MFGLFIGICTIIISNIFIMVELNKILYEVKKLNKDKEV